MKFLEPTDAPPPPKLWGKLAVVMEKLDELEPGRWLPRRTDEGVYGPHRKHER